MGKSRKAWQEVKSQIEDAWGKDFVNSNFKQDLGPTFDQVDNDLAKLVTELEVLEKAVDIVVAKKTKLLGTMNDSKGKLESYGKIVKNKSRQMKTKHGEHWDAITYTIEKGFMSQYNDMNASLRSITEKLKKIVWVSAS